MRISNSVLSFTGRMEKHTFRFYFPFMAILNLVSGSFMTMFAASHSPSMILTIAFLVTFVSMISMMVRRFRDIKVSPLWTLPVFLLFYFVIYIVAIVLCFKDSKYGE